MSTRCLIGVQRENNNVEYIYCHHDGYPSWVGRILKENYSDINKINELMKLGDISALGTTTKHSPDNWNIFSADDECVTYNDRGEETHSNTVDKSNYNFKCLDVWQEYMYLFDGCKWFVNRYGDGFIELTDEIIKND